MLKFLRFSAFILFILGLSGCNLKPSSKTSAPTDEEKVTAIKDALKQGVENATKVLGADGGFSGSDSLEIGIPPEAQAIVNNIKKIPQGCELVESAMSQINKVAEKSVKTINPVIIAAIDSMSVDDVNAILLSDGAAATDYLQNAARRPLHDACEPIIMQYLDVPVVGTITPRNTWNTLAGNYNKVADSTVGKIAGLETVDVALDGYVTDRILDAMFLLIAKEEKNIRKHPATRVSQAMVKSFGWLDKK